MGIPDLIRRKDREAPEPSDLLNGPHKLCECETPGCGCPIIPPRFVREA
jgi:hypothetical protein